MTTKKPAPPPDPDPFDPFGALADNDVHPEPEAGPGPETVTRAELDRLVSQRVREVIAPLDQRVSEVLGDAARQAAVQAAQEASREAAQAARQAAVQAAQEPVQPRMEVSSSQTPVEWSLWHDSRVRAAWDGTDSPSFRQVLADVRAERAGAAQQAPNNRPRCLVCMGAGFRRAVPGWARENCVLCPKCQGLDSEHCRECFGSGRAGGEQVTAPAVPCEACRGSGQADGGGEVLWDLGNGEKLRDNSGSAMQWRTEPRSRQQLEEDHGEPLFLRVRTQAPPVPAPSPFWR